MAHRQSPEFHLWRASGHSYVEELSIIHKYQQRTNDGAAQTNTSRHPRKSKAVASAGACAWLNGITAGQDEVDDLIQDEGEELPDVQDARQLYRADREHQRQKQDMTAEELEAYVQQRFQQPSLDQQQHGDGDAGNPRATVCPAVAAPADLRRL